MSIINLADNIDNVNPKNSAPQSPIKTFARGKLCGKNPITAASKKNEEIVISICPKLEATIQRHSDSLAQIPAARPLRPSIIFVALVIKIIQSAIAISIYIGMLHPKNSEIK